MNKKDSVPVDIFERTIDRFWETFPAVWNGVRRNIRSIVTKEFDITVEQFHILRHIGKGCGSVSKLAKIKQTSRPAISQAVDTLVAKGLIVRHQSVSDRRYVQLELTQSGSELLNAIFKKNQDWMSKKMAFLSQAELNELILAMEMLKKSFG